MIVNQETLRALSKSLSKVFNNSIQTAETQYQKIAMVVPSNALVQNYAWLGATPKMRKWVGDRVLKDLQAHGFTIQKEDWESTIEVTRDDIEYDNLGAVKIRVKSMAEEAKTHYDESIFELIETNGTCYDGKEFFAFDHQISGVPFSNLGNKALSQESFLEYRNEMRGLVNDAGKPLQIRPNILMVPPELEVEALKIAKQAILKSGESNITAGMVEVLVADWLTDPKAWYLLDTRKVIKPFILQINKKMKFVAMDSIDDENVFMRKSFRYGVDSQDNSGYGLWQLAYKSTGEA